jgi:glycosyltransferase involved in cell wall biosynthesis
MKIALIHHQYLPRGGIETQFMDYTHGLIAQGHEVTIVTSKIGNTVQIPAGARVLKADVSRIPKPIRKIFFNRRVGKVMGDHTFDLSIALGRTCHQDAFVCGGTHRGYLLAMSRQWRRPSDWIDLSLERLAYSQSTVIFAVSGMIQRELIELYGTAPEKVAVLHPPVNVNQFHQGLRAKRAELRRKYNINAAKKTFLFVSSGHKRKGLGLILEVFQRLPKDRYELIIAGSKVESSDNVRFVGFSNHVEELYAACDFSVLPSWYEPFGLVVSESIQCGTPAIISDRVGAAEVMGENEGRIVHGFDPETWRETLERISADEFDISPDFAERNALTISQHVQQLVERARGHGESNNA